MEQKTYTKRTNARRAGVQAGFPREAIEITVHKLPEGIRFGWRLEDAAATRMTTQSMPRKTERNERHGVRRPRSGGLCAAVWEWLDANPDVTVKEAKAVAPSKNWNLNNVACEYYAWRKFNDIRSDRVEEGNHPQAG